MDLMEEIDELFEDLFFVESLERAPETRKILSVLCPEGWEFDFCELEDRFPLTFYKTHPVYGRFATKTEISRNIYNKRERWAELKEIIRSDVERAWNRAIQEKEQGHE